MRALEFIRDHVTLKLPYDFDYQMKKTQRGKLQHPDIGNSINKKKQLPYHCSLEMMNELLLQIIKICQIMALFARLHKRYVVSKWSKISIMHSNWPHTRTIHRLYYRAVLLSSLFDLYYHHPAGSSEL